MPGKHHLKGATPKQDRMYTHVKSSELKAGKPASVAKRIAAATTNQHKAMKGLAKNPTGRSHGKHK
jgi:hypothetical protein